MWFHPGRSLDAALAVLLAGRADRAGSVHSVRRDESGSDQGSPPAANDAHDVLVVHQASCRSLGARTNRSEEGGKLLLWLSFAWCLSRVLMRSCSASISPSSTFTRSCPAPMAMMACLSPSRKS